MLNLTAINCNAPEHTKELVNKILAAEGYAQRVLCDLLARQVSGAGERQVVLSPMLPLPALQALAEVFQGIGVKVYLPHMRIDGAEGEEALIQDGLIPVGKF